MSISNYAEAAILDAIFNNTALQKSARYVQLHTADPGEDCTTAVATETSRKSVTGAASSNPGGVFTSVNDLIWTSVAGTETYAYVSIWDASTSGNALWSGALTTPRAVTAGDTFTIPTGSLTVTLA
jgi:hypothetical protein